MISDLCVANPEENDMKRFVGTLIPALANTLHAPELDTGMKLVAVAAIGDLCLICKKEFYPYIEQMMNAYQQAEEPSLAKSDDPEEMEIQGNLREALLDGYTTMYHGLIPTMDD